MTAPSCLNQPTPTMAATVAKRILVAGVGNIFLGDDAFGVEVAQRLARQELPAGVEVRDFGIRSYDLAYALMDGYDVSILVDATHQGGTPGTLYLIEPDGHELDKVAREPVDGHRMNPAAALHLVKTMGGEPGRLFLVGCEPATLLAEDDQLGLSEVLRPLVDDAVVMIKELITQLNTE
ncbi:MAG: hydrogenase maturation protease [Caldilineaceae bacterium]